jgi:2,3-bisphosphoglycerate-independent phosphoglycerate mutase
LRPLDEIVVQADTKIVLVVIDGLGGLPLKPGGPTELEAARKPNLNSLAAKSICGLHHPIAPGITPGSGPAHLALFGYDPFEYQVGRGVLEALGVGFKLSPQDVAARGNFCTLHQGKITDRRAGRISTEECKRLTGKLGQIKLKGAEVFVRPVKEHRFLLVLRGEGLSEEISDTDPQRVNERPLQAKPLSKEAAQTADLVNSFISQARNILREDKANMVLLRGFSKLPSWPSMQELYKLKTLAIVAYPMYLGLARLVGMDTFSFDKTPTIKEKIDALKSKWKDYDFFYLHFKQTDSAGEDGDFERKAKLIEEIDSYIPNLLELDPDVIIITGDHSTPALLRSHSWHPVPILLYSKHCRADSVKEFSERVCAQGGLGVFKAVEIMSLALANALRLTKFGA